MAVKTKTTEDKLRDAEELIRQKSTRITSLERDLRAIRKHNDDVDTIRSELYGLMDATPTPPKWLIKSNDPKLPGVPMTIWSDWHYGEFTSRSQTGGANFFNREIGQKRVKKLVEVTLDLTLNHMRNPEYPGIVVCLGGDMISGFIHDELRETNDGPVQNSVLEVEELLIAAIQEIADNFPLVYVPCVVGNHGRTTIKPRAKNAVYESFEWNIYHHLKRRFAADPKYEPKVHFDVPDETDVYFNVQGHRFLLTHGDNLGVKGGDGIIGVLGPMARGAIKVGRSEAQIGRDFNTLLIGHYHTYVPRSDAMALLANGCLCGYNEYARLRLRVPYSRPSQALWFMHKLHGYTATWPIYLEKTQRTADFKEWVSWQDWRK